MSIDQNNQLNVYADLVNLYPDNEAYLRKYAELLLIDNKKTTAAEVLRHLHDLLVNRGEHKQANALATAYPQIGRIRNAITPDDDRIDKLLPTTMQNRLWLRLHQHKLKEGAHLIHRGDHEETVYLICEGELAEFTQSSDGKPVLLNLITSGNVVGESHLFNPGLYKSDIVANKDSIVAKLPRKKMLAALEKNPSLKIALQQKSASRLTNARISASPLLQNVPLNMRKDLAEQSHTRQYAAGETIHKAGEKLDHVDLVAKGSAHFQLLGKGIFKELKTLGPGSLVGESEAIHIQGCPADMVANCSVTVVRIPYNAFSNVVEAYPPLRNALIAYAEKNQLQIMSKLNELQGDKLD